MEKTPPREASPRTYGGIAEEKRVADRRERLLTAGLEIFGTAGLRGATVRGICRSAGLTERYFYESFNDTEDLFCAVYQRENDALRDRFISEIPQLSRDLGTRIVDALGIYFDMMRDERRVRVLYIDVLNGGERIASMHYNNVRLGGEVAAFLLRSDNPNLSLPDELARAMGFAINGACTTMAVQWMLGGYQLEPGNVVESCTIIVLGTMRELERRHSAHQHTPV